MKEYLWIMKRLRTNFINLLCFELLYRASLYVTVIQCVRLWLNYSLKRLGYSYLTAENYIVVIKSPWVISGIILFLFFLIFLLFFEVCVIYKSWFYGFSGKGRGIRQISFGGLCTFLSLTKKDFAGCMLLSAMTIIFTCTHFLSREFLNVKMLKYALRLFGKWGNGRYIFAVLGVLFVLLCMAGMFAMPVMLCEGKKSLAALRRSVEIFKPHLWICLRTVGLCNVIVTAGSIALYYILMFAAAVFVSLFSESHVAMGILFSMSDGIGLVTGFFSGLFGITLNLQTITGLYLKLEHSDRSLSCEKNDGQHRNAKDSIFDNRQRKKLFAFLIFLLLESCYVNAFLINNGTQIFQDLYAGTMVTAHRGGARNAPENTLAALESAVSSLSDYAEVDVQETKDGELVLLHDSSLYRTTGVSGKIWEMTLEEIKQLDAGSSYGEEFKGENIPTLEEALQVCSGRLDLNIEVKNNGHDTDVAEKTAQLITDLGLENQCVISSMSYDFLKNVKEVNPNIRTGYIMNVAYGKEKFLEFADFLSVQYDCVNERFVRRAHEAGKEVHVWTVNNRRIMRRMKALGVDNIITDRPAVAREILMEDKSSVGFLELMRFAME